MMTKRELVIPLTNLPDDATFHLCAVDCSGKPGELRYAVAMDLMRGKSLLSVIETSAEIEQATGLADNLVGQLQKPKHGVVGTALAIVIASLTRTLADGNEIMQRVAIRMIATAAQDLVAANNDDVNEVLRVWMRARGCANRSSAH